MTTPDEHLCTEFHRHLLGSPGARRYVYRCNHCKRDHTAEEMRAITRGTTVRAADDRSEV